MIGQVHWNLLWITVIISLGRRGENNSEIKLKEKDLGSRTATTWLRTKTLVGSCEEGAESSCSVEGEKFLD